ncbi:MAG: modified peptide precursor CbpA [bacterium]|nr:modified peptide precursor CbpA [bacterium]
MQDKKSDSKIIAIRKSCTATGTGLSHYILIKEDK